MSGGSEDELADPQGVQLVAESAGPRGRSLLLMFAFVLFNSLTLGSSASAPSPSRYQARLRLLDPKRAPRND